MDSKRKPETKERKVRSQPKHKPRSGLLKRRRRDTKPKPDKPKEKKDNRPYYIKVNGVEMESKYTPLQLEKDYNDTRRGGRSEDRQGDNTRKPGEKTGSHKTHPSGLNTNSLRIFYKICRSYKFKRVNPRTGERHGQKFICVEIPELDIYARGTGIGMREAKRMVAKVIHHQYCKKLYRKDEDKEKKN
jgi:hypothetical protein